MAGLVIFFIEARASDEKKSCMFLLDEVFIGFFSDVPNVQTLDKKKEHIIFQL